MDMHAKLPMLAAAPKPDFDIPASWRLEPKLDGHRMLAFVDRLPSTSVADPGLPGVRMYARTGVDKSGKLPEVERWLRDNIPLGTVLDGEIVDLSRVGGEWSSVQSVLGADSKVSTDLTFVVFDVLSLMGEDVRYQSMAVRRLLLERLFEGLHSVALDTPVQLITQREYSAAEVTSLIAAGWEGAIVKDPSASYASGKRGHGWLKIKATETMDVVVTGATDGKGKYAGLIGALTFEGGQCSGMTDSERIAFSDMRDNGTLAGVVIEIQHMGLMPSGGLRHPQFKRLRTDKLPEECVA